MTFDKTYFKGFKNDQKKEGDTKPIYSNSNIKVKEKIVFEPDKTYTMAIWKNDDGTLNVKFEEKDESFSQSPDIWKNILKYFLTFGDMQTSISLIVGIVINHKQLKFII